MRTTQEVWEHHCKAFANADIEEVIADFAENAVYVNADKVINGKEGIRAQYDNHFKNMEANASSTIVKETIAGEIVLFEWTFDSESVSIVDGVDTFVIREGFIQAQTVRATVISKSVNS